MNLLTRTATPAEARNADVAASSALDIARQAETEARERLQRATEQRQVAERNAISASKERRVAADQVARDAERRIADLRAKLADAQRDAEADTSTPTPMTRMLARSWLHGGTPDQSPLECFQRLLSDDGPTGHLYWIGRTAGALMSELAESFAPDEPRKQADVLECLAWRATVDRVRRLAGEGPL